MGCFLGIMAKVADACTGCTTLHTRHGGFAFLDLLFVGVFFSFLFLLGWRMLSGVMG